MGERDSRRNRFEDCNPKADLRPAGAALSAASLPGPQESSVLDRAELLERVGGDRELLAEVVELFLQDSAKQLCELKEAVADGDALRVCRTAHTIKGTVSNLASPLAVATALRLEEMGRGGNLAGAAEGLAALERVIEQLKEALTAVASQTR